MWTDVNQNETSWNERGEIVVTVTEAYPVGLLLVLTLAVTTVTRYVDTWENINNNQTAWQTM